MKMYSEQEQKLKDYAQTYAVPMGYGELRKDTAEPCRASLQERVQSQLYRAERESNKALRLRELTDLLEKNPEIARILDLIEEVRG